MNYAVEVKRLTKAYGNVKAVNEVSFTMEPNKIYGILGRNGAGKTTLMNIITAQLFATSGELKVFGEHPYENQRVLSQICFIKESQKYPDHFRVFEVLDVAANFFPNWDRHYASDLVEKFKLPPKRRMKKLSRGMFSSVGIIIGLASRAPLTIFDEPYLGLDAVARTLFYEQLIADYGAHPRTIILSTHLIDEISDMLEHVLMIDRGKLIVDSEADALRGRAYSVAGQQVKVEAFTTGKQVIAETSMGAFVSAAIMGELNSEERRRAEALGLVVAPISLQQLFVHLTNETTEEKKVAI